MADPEVAIRHARDLVVEGADIIDVGGESTRPGTERTPEHEELRRVLPVVKALVADGVAVSVDTMRASVAKAVVEAGATIVNDVSGGKAEPEILDVVADAGVDYVLMHWRGQSATMQNLVDYDDVVADVISETPSRSTQLLPLESTVGASSSTRALVSPRLPSTTGSS
ncbi:dihydropteroate synthase [Cutibacterium acnes JCM 18918]|nr:dihydropteroate synthase [Cutibacterium acnes JCM 18918]